MSDIISKMIELKCIQYPDLVIKVDPDKLDESELQRIRAQALKISSICNMRCFGEECPGNCPIPKVAVADLNQIRVAIHSLE